MLLELDAGNSRLKWRLSEYESGSAAAGAVLGQGAYAAPGAAEVEQLPAELQQAAGAAAPGRVLVSSVRDAEFNDALGAMLERCFRVAPEFAVAGAECRGVSSGYTDPARLGVDRWLAVVAAYNDARQACCVLDCGTTITLDLVAAGGRHLGGYIVPGLGLLRDTLVRRSTALAVPELEGRLQAGTDTGSAISNGVLSMALGFVLDRLHAHDPDARCRWYLSGGDAGLLGEYLQQHISGDRLLLAPDLVLDGLRLSLLQRSGGGSRVPE